MDLKSFEIDSVMQYLGIAQEDIEANLKVIAAVKDLRIPADEAVRILAAAAHERKGYLEGQGVIRHDWPESKPRDGKGNGKGG